MGMGVGVGRGRAETEDFLAEKLGRVGAPLGASPAEGVKKAFEEGFRERAKGEELVGAVPVGK
jgi:hypothetical protein